jgi:two-component system sensor histidine kinase HydH
MVRRSLIRVAPLASTVVLGAALTGVGVSAYLGAHESAVAVTRTSAADLMLAAQGALHGRVDGIDERGLEQILSHLEPRGLRYLSIVEPDRTRAAGHSERPFVWPPGGLPPPPGFPPPKGKQPPKRPPPPGGVPPPLPDGHGVGPPVELLPDQRVRLIGPLFQASWRPQRPPSDDDWPPPVPPPSALLVIELEPLTALAIGRRATLTLLVSLLATAALLGASVVFSRLSRRAEAAELALERDRQLKALGQMSATLGHELRNPLTALKGHAQLLLEKLPADHPGRPGAERVVHESIRLEELAAQILDFARSGRVEPQPTDPAALARSAVETAAVGSVELTLAPGLPRERQLDAPRMEQVLVNLLRNARHASPPDAAVELRVEARGGALVFEVLDRGEGLPAGDEERIFEPFHTTRTRGTGLGLTLARQIAVGHGGTLRAENRPGGGACFRVTLPLV